MNLSKYHGNNFHIYSAEINIKISKEFPALIKLLLNNEISSSLKLDIIQQMKENHINESIEFAKRNENLKNIYQTILVNEGAWSDNFSQKDASFGIPAFKKERVSLDKLFLYFLEKTPTNLIHETFLNTSNMLTALIVYELPLSLNKALSILNEEEKVEFLKQTQIDFSVGAYSQDRKNSLYFRIFNDKNLDVINVLIDNGFNLNLIDINNQTIGFYLKDKELTEYLISKGLNFDLNYFDGVQKLKTCIKSDERRYFGYGTQFLNFVEDKITLLPPDLEDLFSELYHSFNKDKKTLFKKKFEFFYENTGSFLYKDISITDMILLHFCKQKNYSQHDHSTFLTKFLEKENISSSSISEMAKYFINDSESDKNFKFSDDDIFAFIDKVGTLITLRNEHFSIYPLLNDVNSFLFDKLLGQDKFIENLNTQRLSILADILFLNNQALYVLRNPRNSHNYYNKKIIDKLEKEKINPVLTSLLKAIFIEQTDFVDLQEKLIQLESKYIDFIKKDMSVINILAHENENENKDNMLHSFIERYTITHSLSSSSNQIVQKKRL